MKLLLTSDGITNNSIADTAAKLVGKPLTKTKVAFIMTARNNQGIPLAEVMASRIEQLDDRGIEYVLVEPSAQGNWRDLLEPAELIVIGGGNTFHLLNEMRETGLDSWLIDNNETKVYLGISAGSIIFTPDISIAGVDDGDENTPNITDMTGLGLIDFELSPHTPEDVSMSANLKYSALTTRKLLLMDNDTALQVTDDGWKIISEGYWQWSEAGQLLSH